MKRKIQLFVLAALATVILFSFKAKVERIQEVEEVKELVVNPKISCN